MDSTYITPNQNHFERILAVGAHPDDIELGCFGMLAKYKKAGGTIVHFVSTCGEAGGSSEKRRQEALTSAQLIDAQVHFGNLQDTAVPEGQPTIGMLEAIIKDFKPTCVVVNSPNDSHQDHRAVARATVSAARMVPLVMYYQTPSSNRQFTPNLYVDITETVDMKLRAAKIHESQGKNAYMSDRTVLGLADFRALQVYRGGNYFEGYEIYQFII